MQKGKKSVLKKEAVPSIFRWSNKKRSRTTRLHGNQGLQTVIPASSESVFLLLQEHKNCQNLVLQYLFLISTLEARQSGILELLEKGDDCMADKGFNIKDLLEQIEVTLNTPPLLSEKGQFDEEEVETTQSVASVRIHVERALSRIKMYKIINNVVPLSLAGVLNQI